MRGARDATRNSGPFRESIRIETEIQCETKEFQLKDVSSLRESKYVIDLFEFFSCRLPDKFPSARKPWLDLMTVRFFHSSDHFLRFLSIHDRLLSYL